MKEKGHASHFGTFHELSECSAMRQWAKERDFYLQYGPIECAQTSTWAGWWSALETPAGAAARRSASWPSWRSAAWHPLARARTCSPRWPRGAATWLAVAFPHATEASHRPRLDTAETVLHNRHKSALVLVPLAIVQTVYLSFVLLLGFLQILLLSQRNHRCKRIPLENSRFATSEATLQQEPLNHPDIQKYQNRN